MPNDDLISRKALLEKVFTKRGDFHYFREQTENVVRAIDVINAPAVDAVEVVRCKDCVHYDYGLCEKIQWIMDEYYRGTFEVKQPNDFCSQAEKKGQST